MNHTPAGLSAEEDHGRTSEEEEEGGVEHGYDKQVRHLAGKTIDYVIL